MNVFLGLTLKPQPLSPPISHLFPNLGNYILPHHYMYFPLKTLPLNTGIPKDLPYHRYGHFL